MAKKHWIQLATVVAIGLLCASAAAASTKRGPATQVSNCLDRIWSPIERQAERMAERQVEWAERIAERQAERAERLAERQAERAERQTEQAEWQAERAEWQGEIAGLMGSEDDTGGLPVVTATGEAFEWSRAIPAGKTIEIKGVNGEITASKASGREVTVKATKSWKHSDPEGVTIEVIEHAGGVTICAKYPAPYGKRDNECGPGEKGHMHTENNDVRVDFTVRVPAGVRLIARTVNGGIRAEDLASPVEATTVNGGVRVSTSGYASAETVNGSIVAAFGSVKWPEPVAFTTVNGEIRLTLPAETGAEVRVETMNGSIESDFPITVTTKFSRRRLMGTIGKGGGRLDVETLNGDITLRSAS